MMKNLAAGAAPTEVADDPQVRRRPARPGQPGVAPLSVAQEALWYLSLLVPNQFSYNEAITIRKDGAFNEDAFRRAFNEIVRRHEAWRTTFDIVDGAGVQVLQPPPHYELPVIDLSHLTHDQAESQAVRIIADTSRVPYDLRRGPLLRPRLVRFSDDHHRLYLAMHHLVFDGVSVYRVVLPELVALYDAYSAGRMSPLADPPTPYGEYARWEQQWMTTPRAARRLEHWREHLTPLPVLSLPLDHPRPATARYRGGVVPLSVPTETVGRLREVGQSVGATLFQVLATAWSLLLSRYSGQNDVTFATAADLRQRPELESVVGYSLTPLVLRIDLGGDPSFAALVVRVRNELLDGLDNLVPFERLVRALPPGSASNANPVYQTMFILEPPTVAPDPSWSIHQMESDIGDAVGSAKLDLELELDERPEGHIAGRLIYDSDLFERTTATRMVEHWLRLVGAVAADPTMTASKISILTPTEKHRQLVEWNATTTRRPSLTVADLIRTQTARNPSAPALSVAGTFVTYRELDRRSEQIARRLRLCGVVPGDLVAVCVEPSTDLVAALLATADVGAASLLLDPDLPPRHLDALVADAGATNLVTTAALAPQLAAPAGTLVLLDADDSEGDGGASPMPVSEDAICCVHYSSSAPAAADEEPEVPVAVAVGHHAVANAVLAMAAELGVAPADTVLVLRSTLFAHGALDVWMALAAGASVVFAPSDSEHNGLALSQLIADERISLLHASPAIWRQLLDSGLKGSRALAALTSGGALPPQLADRILGRCRVLWNAYGAPETTFFSTLTRVERSMPVTIGRPLSNTRVYVVDKHDQPEPVGVTGALLVAGTGVAHGYRNRPDLNVAAFGHDAFGPGDVFRTGDRARWLPDGTVELIAKETTT
jgi:non-ribosomal peptide synthetase component F